MMLTVERIRRMSAPFQGYDELLHSHSQGSALGYHSAALQA
jgi:hypothetical protein